MELIFAKRPLFAKFAKFITREIYPPYGNCTGLHCVLQPPDLSVNKALKSKSSSCFSAWYSQEVSKQMEAGTPPDAVNTDLRMSVIKELGCKWLVSAYDHIRSHPDIISNGFRKVVIISALENRLPYNEAVEDLEDDPCASTVCMNYQST